MKKRLILGIVTFLLVGCSNISPLEFAKEAQKATNDAFKEEFKGEMVSSVNFPQYMVDDYLNRKNNFGTKAYNDGRMKQVDAIYVQIKNKATKKRDHKVVSPTSATVNVEFNALDEGTYTIFAAAYGRGANIVTTKTDHEDTSGSNNHLNNAYGEVTVKANQRSVQPLSIYIPMETSSSPKKYEPVTPQAVSKKGDARIDITLRPQDNSSSAFVTVGL